MGMVRIKVMMTIMMIMMMRIVATMMTVMSIIMMMNIFFTDLGLVVDNDDEKYIMFTQLGLV